MRYLLYLLLCLMVVLSCYSCSKTDDRTEIQFNNTFNIFNFSEPALSGPYASASITGFVIGYSLENTTPARSFSGDFGPAILAGAGGEGIPCNDGESYAFSVTDSPVTFLIKVIADTGGDDISDDNDCHCDAKIDYLQLINFAVFFDGIPTPLQFPELKISGTALCPNIPDGHLVNGDREFGGAVEVGGTVSLRVSDTNETIVADVSLHMIEAE